MNNDLSHARHTQARSASGSVSVEAVFVLPLVFGIVFVCAGIMLTFYHRIILESALVFGARKAFVVPAGTIVGPANVKAGVIARAATYGLSVLESDLRVCPVSEPNCSAESVGTKGGLFLVSLRANPWAPFRPITVVGVNR